MQRIDSLVIGALVKQYGLSVILVELSAVARQQAKARTVKGNDPSGKRWERAARHIENLSVERDIVLCDGNERDNG